MDFYLFTARSITQAQRMAQVLESGGIRAGVQRLPVQLTTHGCAYAVRIVPRRFERALSLVRAAGLAPLKVYAHGAQGYREVAV